ncbi:MAG: alpha/beta hydrolase [Dehalococcoidia bacterium]|nr:alpha/beta hydrolase [Dehalococcoidia bacterium]
MSFSEELGGLHEAQLLAGTIRYRERGAGEPIVFAHGALVTGDLWRNVVPALANEFRCITPDLPLGSHRPALHADVDLDPSAIATLIVDLLDALDIEAATLVGNDTGGALCQIVAAEYPERVSRLVLTDCDAFDNFPPRLFRYLQWTARLPGGVFLLAQSMRLRPMRRLPIAYGWLSKRPVDAAVLDSYVRPVIEDAGVRRDVAKLLKGISPSQTIAAARKLGSFPRPALIAWARDDRFFPFDHARRLAQLLPDARLEPVEDSRTFVPEDQPERLAELIGSFMRATAKEPAAANR